jgi:hypothetical protein
MKLVNVYDAAGQLEAEMIKSFLSAQGITAIINQESVGRTYGLSAGVLGIVEVLVPDSQSEEARNLLTAMENGEFEDTEYSDEENDNESQD